MKAPRGKHLEAPPVGGAEVLVRPSPAPSVRHMEAATPAARGASSVKVYGEAEGFASLQELRAHFAEKGVDSWVSTRSRDRASGPHMILSKVLVPKESRSQGTGTEFMKALVALADEDGATISLTPETSFGATSVARLKEFYKRFGFLENKGRHKDWQIGETMIRYPYGRTGPVPFVAKILPLAEHQGFRTGRPATLPWRHNTEGAPRVSWAAQEVEPAGFYVIDAVGANAGAPPLPGWEAGETHLECPLVLEWGGGYQEKSNWKRLLSEAYNGRTGRALSRALVKDGFDGVVTVDASHGSLSEIVLLVPPKAQPAPAPVLGGALDLSKDPAWHDLLFGTPTPARIRELGAFLRADPNRFVRLYHGTDAGHPVMEKGLLPTSATRAKSLQSGHGYVYLSVYPGMAEDFGRMAYPGRQIQVYAVEVTARRLLADLDQLRNKRQWSDLHSGVGNSLAESLVVGHGARVKGKVEPFQLSPLKAL